MREELLFSNPACKSVATRLRLVAIDGATRPQLVAADGATQLCLTAANGAKRLRLVAAHGATTIEFSMKASRHSFGL